MTIKTAVVALLSALLLTGGVLAQQGGMGGGMPMQMPSPEEMRAMIKSMAGEEVKDMMDSADEDKDGTLNWTEFKTATDQGIEAVEALREQEAQMAQFGASLPEELKKIVDIEDDDEALAALEKYHKEQFEEADTDDSQTLSTDELVEFFVDMQMEMAGMGDDEEESEDSEEKATDSEE